MYVLRTSYPHFREVANNNEGGLPQSQVSASIHNTLHSELFTNNQQNRRHQHYSRRIILLLQHGQEDDCHHRHRIIQFTVYIIHPAGGRVLRFYVPTTPPHSHLFTGGRHFFRSIGLVLLLCLFNIPNGENSEHIQGIQIVNWDSVWNYLVSVKWLVKQSLCCYQH